MHWASGAASTRSECNAGGGGRHGSTLPYLRPHPLTITSLDTVRIELGQEAHDELKATINAWWEANDPDGHIYEYIDNYRVALCGDGASELAYQKAQAEGCSGAIDTVFGPLPCGYAFMWGFNYGH